MKRNVLSLLFLLSFSSLLAQQQNLPLILKGTLSNCPESKLQIVFRDELDQLSIDTISVDRQGNFYLKTFNIKAPQKANIHRNNIQINDIFVAPGYELKITADAKDSQTLFRTKEITGIGAQSNRYRLILDSIANLQKDRVPYYELAEKALINFIKDQARLRDSVINIVFNNAPTSTQDKYLPYFKKMVKYDNTFADLSMLILLANTQQYDYEKSIALIKNNFNNSILDHMYSADYMISRYYKDFMVSEYPRFLVRLDKMANKPMANNKFYTLEKVNTEFKEPIKSVVLYKQMDNAIYFSKSFGQLNEYKETFKPFLAVLSNPMYKKFLNTAFLDKEKELFRTEVGKPAPKFTALTASDGKEYSLDDFKGKVIYLDLWASWCGPCRAETPAFKELYKKFQKDERVVFIGIAVSDGMSEWKKALKEDQPEWLQLIDKDGIVAKSYVSNAIPKFILIDKKGNIVSFDAPPPSSKKEIEQLLLTEINKI